MKHLSEEQLQLVAEKMGLLNPEEQHHLEACQSCQAALVFYQKLAFGLSHEKVPELSPAFADVVLQRIPQSSDTKSQEWFWIILMAIAGLLGVAITIFYAGPDLLAAGSAIVSRLKPITNSFPLLITLGVIMLAVAIWEQIGAGKTMAKHFS